MSMPDQTATPAKQVSIALTVYVVLMLSLTAASWIVYHHSKNPQQRPLFDREDRFADLTNYIGKTQHLYRAADALGAGAPVFNYPAPAAFVYKALLHSFPNHPVRPFICLLAISSLAFACVALWASRGKGWAWAACAVAIIATAAGNDPLWYDADRGNIEGIAWILSAAGLCFLLRYRYRSSAVLIGLSAAVKPYPILFLLLLIARRKYREAAIGVATAVAVTVAALTWLGPNPWKAYQALKPGVQRYVSMYVENIMSVLESRTSHSILDGMKSAALVWHMRGLHPKIAYWEAIRLRILPGGWHVARTLTHIYPFIAIPALLLLFVLFRKMPTLNQLTAIAIVTTLFPPSAGEYTLLALLLPFGAWVIFLAREVATGRVAMPLRSMLAFATIYALLLAPLTLLRIYAGDAKLLLLIALLVLAARTPMPSEFFGAPLLSHGPQLYNNRPLAS